jgi:hypothetical protein
LYCRAATAKEEESMSAANKAATIRRQRVAEEHATVLVPAISSLPTVLHIPIRAATV